MKLFRIPKSTVSSLLFGLLLTLMLFNKHTPSLIPQGMSSTSAEQKIYVGKLHKGQIMYEASSVLRIDSDTLMYLRRDGATGIGTGSCPENICIVG